MSSSLDQLVQQASDKHRSLFSSNPTDCGYGSGRINLIGDHTDYNDGLVFPMAVPLYSVIVGRLSDGNETTLCTTCSDLNGSDVVSFPLENLTPGEPSCK
jgi:galactokinase